MRAAESAHAIHAEGVIPDDPTPAGEAEVVLGDQFQLGRVFVADRQPEGAVGLEHPLDAADPFPRPVKILLRFALVVVNVVIVADIEGRIGKDQIDAAGGHLLQPFNATTFVNPVECEHISICSAAIHRRFRVRRLAVAFQYARRIVWRRACRIGVRRQAAALQNKQPNALRPILQARPRAANTAPACPSPSLSSGLSHRSEDKRIAPGDRRLACVLRP